MPENQRCGDDKKSSLEQKDGFAAPSIALPKGGGAIRGIGENGKQFCWFVGTYVDFDGGGER